MLNEHRYSEISIMSVMSVKNRVVLVTGGTGALGSVIAGRCADGGGIVTVTSYQATEKTDTDIRVVHTDVTDEASVKALFDRVVAESGRIDVLINTVGGFLPKKNLTDLSKGEWDLMMNINLSSTFLCTREALIRMKGQSYGRIINFSAMVGLSPSAGRSAYAISKAGVVILTEVVAQEIKGSGITINAIAPSIIDTPANRSSMPKEDFSRWVPPASIADAILYLCAESSRHISGTTIRAFGGI
jgi:NAD(P)-dependent dehydrogenase (short-subunit alcohol dehydrogenase family)